MKAACHAIELVERREAADDREREEPPAAYPHDPEHDGQEHDRDEQSREERAHARPRPPESARLTQAPASRTGACARRTRPRPLGGRRRRSPARASR